MKLPRFVLFKKILSDIMGPIFAIIVLAFAGAYAFSEVEGISFSKALYFIVTTLSTVGFGDVVPKTSNGRLVAMIVIVLGITIISISVSSIGNRVIKNMLNHDFRYEQAIKSYSGHVIIAGYGDIGRRIVQYLSGWRINLVVIDNDLDQVQSAREDSLAAIHGDISNPRELHNLNIKNAQGIVLAINDPNVTLFAGQAAKVANEKIWVVAEKNIHYNEAMYRSVHISKSVDRFSASKSKIRGILWGLEIESYDFSMKDGISFFQVPSLPGLQESDFINLDFILLGAIHNNNFEKFKNVKQLEVAEMLLIAGPSSGTKNLMSMMKSHVPPDDDGVVRVIVVGYGDYAETILAPILSNSDEVLIIDISEERRKMAKKDGGAKVEVKSKISKEKLKTADIILLTSKAAGHMLAIGVEAKTVNPKVKVYARATLSEHTAIFENAGADYVFSPEVDCAVKLSSTVIDNIFQTLAIPFANGQLLYHTGDVKIKKVSNRQILATYNDKKGKTKFFGKKSSKKGDQILEFVTFKKSVDILNIDKIIYGEFS